MEKITELLGRVLLGHIFLLAGLNKISGYEGTQAYMEAMGVPGAMLPLVILLEIAAGLAVIIGYKAQWASYALAGFSVLAALLFHADFADQMQMILFMKNMAITGGLLLLATHGAGEFSLDKKLALR